MATRFANIVIVVLFAGCLRNHNSCAASRVAKAQTTESFLEDFPFPSNNEISKKHDFMDNWPQPIYSRMRLRLKIKLRTNQGSNSGTKLSKIDQKWPTFCQINNYLNNI